MIGQHPGVGGRFKVGFKVFLTDLRAYIKFWVHTDFWRGTCHVMDSMANNLKSVLPDLTSLRKYCLVNCVNWFLKRYKTWEMVHILVHTLVGCFVKKWSGNFVPSKDDVQQSLLVAASDRFILTNPEAQTCNKTWASILGARVVDPTYI